MRLKDTLPFARKYLLYILTFRHKWGFGIHSPFAYQLITQVFRSRGMDLSYGNIEILKGKLAKSKEKIAITGFGAGSAYSNSTERTIAQIIKHSTVNKKYGRLLFRITKHFNPTTIIELGTSMGISTAYFSVAAKNASIFTIEGEPGLVNIARMNFNTLGINNITLVEGDFGHHLLSVLEKAKHPMLVFFDGNHTKDATLRYFYHCMEYKNAGTVFIFDDIHWSKGMEEAWAEIKRHKDVKVTIDLFRMGLVFFRDGLQKQDYIINF